VLGHTKNINSITLLVAEASQRDFGRGIARIDPDDMKRIGAETGDVVQINGKRGTAAKVMPAYPENRGKGTIQIDGITRGNAFTGIKGVKLALEKYRPDKAEYFANPWWYLTRLEKLIAFTE